MRRLFFTFASGWPGLGLLLIRSGAGIVSIAHGVMLLRGGGPIVPAILSMLAAVAGTLVLIGLWTPVAAAILAIIALRNAAVHPGNPLAWFLLATISAALTLLGPGRWSIDALLFGWKRIDIPD